MIVDTRPRLSVHVVHSDETFLCAQDETLLQGMLRLGRRGIPVGCVNGGCGVCKVRILDGQVKRLGPVSRAHVSVADEVNGCTLACRVAPVTAVRLEPVGKLAKPFTRGLVTTAATPSSKCVSASKET